MPNIIPTIQGIDPYDLYLSFASTVNTFIGGWFRPNTDFIVKANDISNAMWVKWTAIAEKSQEARDNLIFFLKSKSALVKKSNSYYGTFNPPADYGRFASAKMYVTSEGKTIPAKGIDKCDPDDKTWDDFKTEAEKINDYYKDVSEVDIANIDNQRWSAFTRHETKKPTMGKPGITQINASFQVAPRDITVVVLNYYVKPTNAVFAYEISPGDPSTGEGDQLLYNNDKSKALPWPNTIRNEFIAALGEAYSFFTREQFWAQFNNQLKKTG